MSLVVMYKGRRGAGKTLTMVKDAYKYYLNGYKILSNIKLPFGELINESDILALDKESNLYNCVILLDELQIFFESRRSMKKQNLDFSNFIQQLRKRNITLLGTTQYSNTVDLRFRQHTDIIAYPRFIEQLNVCEVIYTDVTAFEDTQFMDESQLPSVKIVYSPIEIFKLYNTYEMLK